MKSAYAVLTAFGLGLICTVLSILVWFYLFPWTQTITGGLFLAAGLLLGFVFPRKWIPLVAGAYLPFLVTQIVLLLKSIQIYAQQTTYFEPLPFEAVQLLWWLLPLATAITGVIIGTWLAGGMNSQAKTASPDSPTGA